MVGFREFARFLSPRVRLIAPFLLCILLLLPLSSCCGGRGLAEETQSTAEDGFAGLPPPSAVRQASSSSTGLLRDASNFLATPESLHQNVSPVDGSCQFTPDWSPDVPQFAGLAFACYEFDMAGYNLVNQIGFFWDQPDPGGDPADLWVGLADYSRNAWSWHAMPEFSPTEPATLAVDFAPFIDPDSKQMFVLVLATGTAAWELERIHVGDLTDLSGQVVVADGQTPMDYAEVRLRYPSDDSILTRYSVRTGPDGYWQIHGVRPGTYVVSALVFGWSFTPDSPLLTLDANSLELELPAFVGTELPRYAVSGKVSEENGTPVSWVALEALELSLANGVTMTVTGDDGTWSMDLPDGDYRMSARREGWGLTPNLFEFTVAGSDIELQDIIGTPLQ